MRFESFIGLRYFWNSQRKGVLSLITLISVVGMALGVAALISVLSVMDGFLSQMKTKILGATAHAHFYKLTGTFDEHEKIANRIRAIDGVAGVTPSITNEVMVSANSEIVGGLANGIDIKTIGEVVDLPGQIRQGRLECLDDIKKCSDILAKLKKKDAADDILADDSAVNAQDIRPVMIGADMAKALKTELGDIVTVISPMGGGSGVMPVPVSKSFRVVGIFYTGMYDYDFKFLYMSINDARDFFKTGDSVSFLNIKVRDIYKIKEISDNIMNAVEGFPYSIQDWMDMNKSTFKFLQLQKMVMFIILIFIILVASFGIISTLIMLVMGKTHEISILKSLGATNGTIMRIFMLDGFAIGLAGTVAGMLLAVIICLILQQIDFPLAKDIYFFKTLPVEMSAWTFGIVAASSMLISLLATVYPSWQASRIRPTEGLRYE